MRCPKGIVWQTNKQPSLLAILERVPFVCVTIVTKKMTTTRPGAIVIEGVFYQPIPLRGKMVLFPYSGPLVDFGRFIDEYHIILQNIYTNEERLCEYSPCAKPTVFSKPYVPTQSIVAMCKTYEIIRIEGALHKGRQVYQVKKNNKTPMKCVFLNDKEMLWLNQDTEVAISRFEELEPIPI